MILKFSADDGETYTAVAGGLQMDSALIDTSFGDTDTSYLYHYFGVIDWTVPADPTSGGYVELMAWDTTFDTISSNPVGRFKIPPPGGNQYATGFGQSLIGEGISSGKIGIAYQGQESDTSSPIIYYLDSDEGLAFDAPDSLGEGVQPAQDGGCVAWLGENLDTVFYSGWNADSGKLVGAPVVGASAGALATEYAAPAISLVGDTVHLATLNKAVVLEQYQYLTKFTLKHFEFLKDQPSSISVDSMYLGYVSGVDSISDLSVSMALQDSNLLLAFMVGDSCFYMETPLSSPSINHIRFIGSGLYPRISVNEGNETYSYLSSNAGSLIRLWGYRGDTTWVERDTFSLKDTVSSLAAVDGLLYGVQRTDTALTDMYIYDVMNQEPYHYKTYSGYYSHPYIDDASNELAWIAAYTEQVDDETFYFTTERRGFGLILPALYLEADDKRSPYTILRDTCIHYTTVDVDSGADSLAYLFPYLNSSNSYSLIIEFYTECDSSTTLLIQTGTNVDTLQIPGESFSWFHADVASGTDSLPVIIRRISQNGFVPVSRVIIWRPNTSSSYIMGMPGQKLEEPVPIPFCLYQPFPNPFGDAATIRYSVPYATHVNLKVYDVSGRMVTKLVDGEVDPGLHTLRWEGRDDINRRCASGVYFVRFAAEDYVASKKMVLLK